MGSDVTTKTLHIGGMTCSNCRNKIGKKLRDTAGVKHIEVNYSKGIAVVTYDANIISIGEITAVIKKLGYEVLKSSTQESQSRWSRALGAMVVIVALYIMMQQFGFTQIFNNFQLVEVGMGYGMIVVIGFVTSVHCMGMCGGINISQCIPAAVDGTGSGKLAALRPAFQYNLGRVLSYTVIGGMVGALGSVISLSGRFSGMVQIAAGVFMVVMGLNMLGFFPGLRKLLPPMPKTLANKIDAEKGRSKSPLYIGLLNGLMPCGPLQAMQLYALSTGSPFKGALSMLLFSLGTLPLMFGLGALSSVLSIKFTRKLMTVGAVLVAVLGLSMFSQGWSLSGYSNIPIAPAQPSGNAEADLVAENDIQTIASTLSPRGYPAITVQAGIPVKWTIQAPQGSINGCNNRIFIPEYNIEHTFSPGENVIEFIPEKAGTFPYSCWMGMIRSTITVVA